jgi:glycosyltransferase 2 family protein
VSKLLRRTLYTVAVGVLLYVGAVIWFDVEPLARTLADFAWSAFAGALALSAGNYLLRFAKWELSLGWLRVREQAPGLTRGRSLVIYLAGLSMSVTPGKVGEVLRSILLKASDGVPFTRTAPVVVADRLTDLVALVILSLVGLGDHPEYLPYAIVTAVLVGAGVLVLGTPRWLSAVLDLVARIPRLAGIVARARPLVDSSATLLRLRPLLVLTLLSVIGWGLECVGFWLVLGGFSGVAPLLPMCAFLWAMSTLVGALSFLPGGLLATEGSLTLAAMRLVPTSESIALAATLLARTATLWFGEIVGGVALAVFLRDPKVRAEALAVDPTGAKGS